MSNNHLNKLDASLLERIFGALDVAAERLTAPGLLLVLAAVLAVIAALLWSFAEGFATQFSVISTYFVVLCGIFIGLGRESFATPVVAFVLYGLVNFSVYPLMERHALAPVGDAQATTVTDIQVVPGGFHDTYRIETTAGLFRVRSEPNLTRDTDVELVRMASEDGFLSSEWLCKGTDIAECIKVK